MEMGMAESRGKGETRAVQDRAVFPIGRTRNQFAMRNSLILADFGRFLSNLEGKKVRGSSN
jgi:hypothetical protein